MQGEKIWRGKPGGEDDGGGGKLILEIIWPEVRMIRNL
jgi:hypothetical protein